jgi:serine/threonine-protein kinase
LIEEVTDTGDVSRPVGAIQEGAILAGKYRVERLLGAGGMGLVVAARHLQLDERVAIKLMLPATLGNPDAVARFTREARAAAKIKGEHVARVFDIGTLEDGAPYMVMEFLEGHDLADWMSQRGRLPVDLAVEFVLQACVAVADAHALGIVHRDLKPANLFCVRRPDGQLTIKVLDFGISKLLDAGSLSGATKTNTVMGSPHYMSPEQMQSAKDVDARTDIWALGVVLYQLLTGSLPFGGESYAEVAIKVATQAALPLRRLRPDAPAALEAAVSKCLQKEKAQRYQNVGVFADALAEFAPNRTRRLAEPIVESTLLEPTAFPETIPPVGVTSFGRKRRGAVLGIGTAAAAVLLAGGLAAWRAPPRHTGDTSSANTGIGSQEPGTRSAVAALDAEPPTAGPLPPGTTHSVGAPAPPTMASAVPAADPAALATSSPAPTASAKRHPPARPLEPPLARAPAERGASQAASAAAATPARATVPPSQLPSTPGSSNALDLPLMR